jgi:hypothetical protein
MLHLTWGCHLRQGQFGLECQSRNLGAVISARASDLCHSPSTGSHTLFSFNSTSSIPFLLSSPHSFSSLWALPFPVLLPLSFYLIYS